MYLTNSMEHQDVPSITEAFPISNVLAAIIQSNAPTVNVKVIDSPSNLIIGVIVSRPRLFVACRYNRLLEAAAFRAERVTEG